MAIHDHLHRRHPEGIVDVVDRIVKREVSTVYEVVYTTASPTFTDAIAGYSTVGATDNTDDSAPTSTPEPTPAEASSTSTPAVIQAAKSSSKSSSAVPKTTLSTSVSSLPSSIPYTSTTLPTTLAIAAASGKASSDTASSHATGTSGSAASAVSSTSSGTSTSSADSSSEGGMSTAGTAGLVVGILLLLGAVLAIVLLCFRKRRKAAGQERAEDEKHEFAAMERHASTRTTATAPRLSLRPVTQFLPNLNVKRASRGNDLLAVSENGNTREIDRPSTAHSQNPANPFGNHAQSPASMPENPFGAEAHVVSPDSSVTPDSPIDAANANGPEVVDDFTGEEIIVGAALGGDAASGSPALKRSVSKRGIAPSPMDFTKSGPFMGPPSPVGTEFSMTSDASVAPLQTGGGAAIAAAGGPASSTVHRVQLDFFPSMEDELDLRQGSLVRLLHEYDDGWVSVRPSLNESLLTSSGSLYPSRSFETRCRSSYLPFSSTCQASPDAKTERSSRQLSKHAWSSSRLSQRYDSQWRFPTTNDPQRISNAYWSAPINTRWSQQSIDRPVSSIINIKQSISSKSPERSP